MLSSVDLLVHQNLGWSWEVLTQHPCKTIVKHFSAFIFEGVNESGEELGQRRGSLVVALTVLCFYWS